MEQRADFEIMPDRSSNETNEELLRRYRSGEDEVKNDIILNNTGLINAFIWKNRWLFLESTSMTEDDYFQEGILALYDAIEKYDPERGSFSNFAFMILRVHLYRAYHEKNRTIRIPSWRHNEFIKFKKNEEVIAAHLGHEPSLKELSRFTGYSTDEILAFRSDFKRITSLNTPMSDEADSGSLGDYVMDSYNYFEDVEKDLYLQQLRKDLDEAMDTLLTRNQKKILCASIGWKSRIQKSHEVIAGENQISKQEVKRALAVSLQKLRYAKSRYLSKNYTDLLGYEIQKFTSEERGSSARTGMISSMVRTLVKPGEPLIINGYEGVATDFFNSFWFQFTYRSLTGSERTVYLEYKKIVDYVVSPDRKLVLQVKENLR